MAKDDTSKQPDLMNEKDVPEREIENLQKSLSDSDVRGSKEKEQQL